MATTQDAIQRLQIQTSAPGADDATDSMNKLATSMGGVAVASSSIEKTTSSLDSKFASIERRYNDQVKALQDYQKIQNTVNAAVAQNPALLDRGNAVLAVAKQRYDDATGSQSLFQKSLTGVQSQIIALSAGLGPVGTALAALGPAGLIAGAAIGLVGVAFDEMSKRADELASKATGLNNFASVTGLTTDEVQALTETASKLGVSSEQTQTFIDSFTSKLTELRTASGPLYDAIVKVDAGIAQQMLTAKGTTAELDLFAKAYKEAAAAGNGNALLTAAGGRVGVTQGPVVGAIADAGGLDAMNAAMDQGSRLANSLVLQLKDLKAQNDNLKEDIQNNIASLFSTEVLANQVKSRTTMLGLTESLKEFKLSGDWSKFVSDISTIANADVPDWWKTFYNYVTGVASTSNSLPSSMFSNAFGANFSPSHAAEGPQAPAAPQAGTEDPVATANKFKTLEGVLGSAATITDQFNAKLAGLVVAARAAGVPADQLVGIQNQLTTALNASGGASEAYGRALSAIDLDKATALQNTYNSALGASTPIADLVNAKELSLQKLRQQNPKITQDNINQQVALTASQALGTYQIQAQIDSETVKQATIGMSVGSAAAYTAAQTVLNKAVQDGKLLTDAEVASLQAKAAALGVAAQASAQAAAQDKANFDLQTAGMSSVDAQIAQLQKQLHGNDWQSFMNDGLAATTRLADATKQLNTATTQFGTDLLSGLLQGKTAIDSLTGAATTLVSTLASAQLKQFLSSGSLFGNQNLGSAQGAVAIGSAGLSAYSSGNPLTGALGGALAGAAFGPVGAAVGGIAGAIGGFLGQANNAKQALEQAQAQWAAMAQQVNQFTLAAKGVDLGPLTNELDSLFSSFQQLHTAAMKANDLAGAASASNTFNEAVTRIVGNFIDGTSALTPLQQSIKAVNDEAAGLTSTLDGIGPYGLDASINAAAQAQIANIVAQFATSVTTGLQARLNTANGKDYLNSAQDVLTQHQTDLSNAAELGNPASLMSQISATFAAEAQKVVNDAGLVGDQFNSFIQLFPQFAGVVTQSATAIQAANDNFAALTKTINDYLNSLQLGSNSILSPQDQLNAAQSQFNAQLSLAQQGNTDALGSITQYASTLLDQAKGYYASSQGYTDIYSAVTDALKGLTTMPTPGLVLGGMVPGYVNGGMIGNGTFGVDSVIARYAGGGSIALAGGEYVMPAAQTQAHLPMLEAMRSGGGGASNDNGGFAMLGQQFANVMAAACSAEINAINTQTDALRSEIRGLKTAIEGLKPKAPRPNAKVA